MSPKYQPINKTFLFTGDAAPLLKLFKTSEMTFDRRLSLCLAVAHISRGVLRAEQAGSNSEIQSRIYPN